MTRHTMVYLRIFSTEMDGFICKMRGQVPM
jgi:hypothetical protein